MMVTFVSECEKNALKKTRRVLDAFADRIGNNTWQTLITEDGLQTVKKMLRQTASRSTAVSCHWIRSRSRSQLLWVVGNRSKFNLEGVVPVNRTTGDITEFYDAYQWKTLNEIKYAAEIAGLFHDFGKANLLFQRKLEGKSKFSYEPYRHEWISLRMFHSFVGNKSANEWLTALIHPDKSLFNDFFRDGLDGSCEDKNPLTELTGFAQLVGWLILSHHKLPLSVDVSPFNDAGNWMVKNFSALWNSPKCLDPEEKSRIKDNWVLANPGCPVNSFHWCAKACFVASAAKASLQNCANKNWLTEDVFTSHLARLSLMLADHYYSARGLDEVQPEWSSENYKVIANTDKNDEGQKVPNQQLDEHLIGVSEHAGRIATSLAKLNDDLPSMEDNDFLSKRVSKESEKKGFAWQNSAQKLARNLASLTKRHGFFGINMASTGKGKTIANAKIMYALGKGSGRTRFNVALGLRSLTLQTGREYLTQLDLTDEELAIVVGGSAVKQLFEMNEQDKADQEVKQQGSESREALLEPELHIDYRGMCNEHSLSEWTQSNNKVSQLLDAPVLVCTIDHLMPACEGVRGGKQIPSTLRLLTSDLVLDEPDDFGLTDLPALCRLVYWSGMLGSKVLLSTATMPQALANALFRAYKAGWSQYAKANTEHWNGEVCCAWFDEFDVKDELIKDNNDYKKYHQKFISHRIDSLAKTLTPKRLGYILNIDRQSCDSVYKSYAKTIRGAIENLHREHACQHQGKSFSIGLVRMANINPLVAVAKELLDIPCHADTQIHYCVYHSAYPLAIRSYVEKKLDKCLKRNNKKESWPPQELTNKLDQHPEKHNIFVVIASPVAEVGRDHDYDWAIIEPSSMRSIVQLAGRLLRHRNLYPLVPNMYLLNQNIKALNNKEVCFTKPGYESKHKALLQHDLKSALDLVQYEKIDATYSISLSKEKYRQQVDSKGKAKFINLVELEYSALAYQLFTGDKAASAWWEESLHWCAEVQKQQRFRASAKDDAYYLFVEDETSQQWLWKNEAVFPAEFTPDLNSIEIISVDELTLATGNYFWFELEPLPIYQQLAEHFELDLNEVAKRFAELRVIDYQSDNPTSVAYYHYHHNLGLHQKKESR